MHKHMANERGVQRIGSFKTKANCHQTEVTGLLSTRSWGGTSDEPFPHLHRRLIYM